MNDPTAASAAVNGTAPEAAAPLGSDEMLRLQGFLTLRDQIIGIARQTGAMQIGIYDTVIQFAETAKSRAQLEGATTQQLDDLDNQIEGLKAVRNLRQRLMRIDERAAARARLR